MSDAAHHDPTVPRGALMGAAAVLIFTLALTGAVKLGILPHSGDPTNSRIAENVSPAQSRELRFADRKDGTVLISDAKTSAAVTVIKFGEGGFVRATMRRMAKARKAAGISAEPPFKLIRWENGALTLKDPQTGREAELHGFGPDHSKFFSDMLKES
jgi:putative photosynthetic complex assembly protein